ncbi:hypothetical protein [Vibrio hepatarius]|uniref:hypothetical protein n=1 Tax=Vibrio hepatarius TaxID=171383 RepID=UPI001C09EE1A|nr:hypothetical protein [Vibrio hepatarius]MBU2898322.1 hypothetical protein [Vibrio hepatarius]
MINEIEGLKTEIDAKVYVVEQAAKEQGRTHLDIDIDFAEAMLSIFKGTVADKVAQSESAT